MPGSTLCTIPGRSSTSFAAHDPRRLVHGHAESVPGAVHEVLAVAGVLDHPPCGGVDRRAVAPGREAAMPAAQDALTTAWISR